MPSPKAVTPKTLPKLVTIFLSLKAVPVIIISRSKIYLTREAMKRCFAEYEDYMNGEFVHPGTKEKATFRKCFRIQIERLASSIKGEKEYIPFCMEVCYALSHR